MCAYLDAFGAETRWWTPFQVRGQILVHMLEHHVEDQLLLVFQSRPVTDIQ